MVYSGQSHLEMDTLGVAYFRTYPLVNVYVTMETHHLEWVQYMNQLFLRPLSIAFGMFTRWIVYFMENPTTMDDLGVAVF